MESQQHVLCDVTEILMDLRRLVAAHGEFLANFRHHTLTEEPPDSLDERSPSHPPWHTRPPDQQPVAAPPQCWTIPPSITQPPLAVKADPLPRLRFDPPRFDGENAQDWIHKIQNYYNSQYMPLHDRLYLTKYLFDHPASEWMAYWEENNKGKGWDEFLIDVRQRFEPDSHDEYVGRLPALRQTCQAVAVVQGASPRPAWTSRDERQHFHNTASLVQVQDIISAGPPPPLMDLISHEIDASIPVLNSERRDSSMEAVVAAPVVFNEPRPETIIGAQAIATDSSILDAADSVLDVTTKSCSMEEVVFDDLDNVSLVQQTHRSVVGAPHDEVPPIDVTQLIIASYVPIPTPSFELCPKEENLHNVDDRELFTLQLGRDTTTIGWRLPPDRMTCSIRAASAPAVDSLLSRINTAVTNTQPLLQVTSDSAAAPNTRNNHKSTENSTRYARKFRSRRKVSPPLSTASTRWGCEILRFDEKKEVHIFDPGDFKSTSTLRTSHSCSYFKGSKELVTSRTSSELLQDEKVATIVAANSKEREGKIPTSSQKKFITVGKLRGTSQANVIENIPNPLLDRMEVVSIVWYIADEKMHIEATKAGYEFSWSYFDVHLEGKVVFNGGRVDRVLEHLNRAQDHVQISLNLQLIF